MIPRFACLLLFLSGALSFGSLRAEEEPEKPDPDRFGHPVIRAWYPATLANQHRDLRWQIHKEMQREDFQEPEYGEPPQQKPFPREGLLVCHDPQGIDRQKSQSQRTDGWYDASSQIGVDVQFVLPQNKSGGSTEVRK